MTNGSPLVSTVVIFLDAARFLEEAIESVFAQTYRCWELVLVDDGSTDGSSEIARRYARQHPRRVRYVEHAGHANRGMSASRNAGVQRARGGLVALLDADDIWLPRKLEEQVAIAEAHPRVGLICGATTYWWSWNDSARRDVVMWPGVRQDVVHEPPQLSLALYPLGRGTAPCPSDVMFRRSVWERVGGFEERFRGELQLYEDQAFFAKLYLETPVYVGSAVWDRYRQHSRSCVSTVKRSGRYNAVRKFFLGWLEETLSGRSHVDRRVWRALDRALWPYRHPLLAGAARRLAFAR